MLGLDLRRLRLHRAARLYARRLPRQLRTDYGGSETYTPAQITRAVERARLPLDHLHLGFALFLAEDVFKPLGPRVPGMTYAELRSLLTRHLPADAPSASSWPNEFVPNVVSNSQAT